MVGIPVERVGEQPKGLPCTRRSASCAPLMASKTAPSGLDPTASIRRAGWAAGSVSRGVARIGGFAPWSRAGSCSITSTSSRSRSGSSTVGATAGVRPVHSRESARRRGHPSPAPQPQSGCDRHATGAPAASAVGSGIDGAVRIGGLNRRGVGFGPFGGLDGIRSMNETGRFRHLAERSARRRRHGLHPATAGFNGSKSSARPQRGSIGSGSAATGRPRTPLPATSGGPDSVTRNEPFPVDWLGWRITSLSACGPSGSSPAGSG